MPGDFGRVALRQRRPYPHTSVYKAQDYAHPQHDTLSCHASRAAYCNSADDPGWRCLPGPGQPRSIHPRRRVM